MNEPVIDEQGRPEPPLAAPEVPSLVGFLDYQRATLEWKTRGLDNAELNAKLHPTSMTLGGLLKHISWVEDYWFTYRLHGRPPQEMWREVDWDAEPEWPWTSAANDDPDELRRLWTETTERSRRLVDEALEKGGPEFPCAVPWPDGSAPSLRWLLLHMIEEYARHNGHADLLRESIDGETGE